MIGTDVAAFASLSVAVLIGFLSLEGVVEPHVLSAKLQQAWLAPWPTAGDSSLQLLPEDDPMELLFRQLRDGSAPEGTLRAAELHRALAALTASGARGSDDEALRHLEAARDHAARAAATAPPPQKLGEIVVWVGPEREALVEARLALAQAYLDRGRASDADRELDTVQSSLVGLEDLHMAAVLRAHGDTKRERGFHAAALKLYKLAMSRVEISAPYDRAAAEELVSDMAGLSETLILQAKIQEAEQTLRDALATLRAPMAGLGLSAGGEAAEAATPGVAAELHRLLGDALAGAGDFPAALRHYGKALRLERRMSPLRKDHIVRLEERMQNAQAREAQPPATKVSAPSADAKTLGVKTGSVSRSDRSPPSLAKAPTGTAMKEEADCNNFAPSTRPKSVQPAMAVASQSRRQHRVQEAFPEATDGATTGAEEPLPVRVSKLLADGKVRQAEAACSTVLAAFSKGGSTGGLEVASVRFQLGKVYRRQQRFAESAQEFLQVLALSFASGKSDLSEVEEAYKSLTYIQVMHHALGQAEAAEGILRDAEALADAAGVRKDRPDRESGERILRANAYPSVVMKMNGGNAAGSTTTDASHPVRHQ